MNLRQIEVFKAVMETGTVTGAAGRLHVSQPAVSKILAQLERDLGFNAFSRIKGRLVPNAEARALYGQVERAFLSMDYLARFARDLRDLRQGHLVLGAMPALSVRWMPSVIARFLRAHPHITVSLQALDSPKILSWVAGQQIDLGIAQPTLEDPGVKHERLTELEMVCVIPVSHPLAKRQAVTPSALQDVSFISLGPWSRLGIDRVLEAAGIRRRIQLDTVLGSTTCGFVAEGLGVAIIDCVSASDNRHRDLVVRRFRPLVKVEIHLLEPLNRPRSRLVDLFVKHLKQCVDEDRVGTPDTELLSMPHAPTRRGGKVNSKSAGGNSLTNQ